MFIVVVVVAGALGGVGPLVIPGLGLVDGLDGFQDSLGADLAHVVDEVDGDIRGHG